MRTSVFIAMLFMGLSGPLQGQSIFGLHGVLGVNASQIRGDLLAGFDKVGICGGLRGTVELKEPLGLSVELLYSERGSRPDIFGDVFDPDINVTLRYLEMPVYLTYSDWRDTEDGYHKAFALAGISLGRLIESSTFDAFNEAEMDLDSLAMEFNQNDLSWLVGFGFRLSNRFIISARYTRSITLLLNAEKKGLNTNSLRVFFLSFRGEYVF